MIRRRLAAIAAAAALLAATAVPLAQGAEIAPHRALYVMTLASTRGQSTVTDAQGAMEYEWGETCDGWTVQQRYLLRVRYAGSPGVRIQSNFVTWEAKSGLRYRFNQRQTRDGKLSEQIRGTARLTGPGRGGVAEFSEPTPETFPLPPGVLFPSAHTILLIDQARAGKHFLVRRLFDGASEEGAVEVSAVIGSKTAPGAAAKKYGALLDHPSWPVQLAFFPADPQAETPQYQLGMQLLADGVSQSVLIDYGAYAIRAKLNDIEPLAKPRC